MKNWSLHQSRRHCAAMRTDSVSLPTYSLPMCITSMVICKQIKTALSVTLTVENDNSSLYMSMQQVLQKKNWAK